MTFNYNNSSNHRGDSCSSSYCKLENNDEHDGKNSTNEYAAAAAAAKRRLLRRSSNDDSNNNKASCLASVWRLPTLSPIACIVWLWSLAFVLYVSYSVLLSRTTMTNSTSSSLSSCAAAVAAAVTAATDADKKTATAEQNAHDFAEISALARGTRQCVPVDSSRRFEFRESTVAADAAAAAAAVGEKTSAEKIKKQFRHPLIVHYIRIIGTLYANDLPTELSKLPAIFNLSWQLERLHYLSVLSAWKALLEAREYDKEQQQQQQRGTVDGGGGETDDDADADANVGAAAAAEPVIYIHSNIEPSGKYWNMLRDSSKGVNVKWNYIEHTAHIGGFTPGNIEHEADFHKVNATYFFGGVHSDFDVILVNGKNMRQLQYDGEVFMSVDCNYRSQSAYAQKSRHGYPYMLNCGFFSGVKNSSFLKIWRDMYLCDFRSDSWIYNSGLVPRMMYDAYKAQPLALDWRTGSRYRIELLNEAEDAGPGVLSPSTWRNYPAVHFYHVEHFKIDWNLMLYNSTSTYAQVLRWVQFGSHKPLQQTSSAAAKVDWE